MTLSKAFLAYAHNASNETRNPEWALKAMKHIMKSTVQRQKAEHKADLFRTLVKKKIPPSNIATACKKLCSKLDITNEQTVANVIMREILHNTQRKVTQAKYEATQIWRQNRRALQTHNVKDSFCKAWIKEKELSRRCLQQARRKKVTFLANQHKQSQKKPSEDLFGIIIKDQQLPINFESKPRTYDDLIITEAEGEVMQLGPKFAVFEQVKQNTADVELEKAFVKLRWNARNEPPSPEDDKEEEDTENTRSEYKFVESNEREWPYNVQNQTLNLTVLRPTDLPFNKEVYLPEILDNETESKLQYVKNELRNVTKSYIETHSKNEEGSNLTNTQKMGLDSLTKKKNVVVFQTDKSGRFSIDSKENYIEASKPHYEKDITIDEETHEKAQKEANGHSIMWSRILKAGEGIKNGEQRIKTNLLVENNGLASQYTLRKDHKTCNDPKKGPPVRPVCGATNAYNNKLSHLLSMIIKPMNKLSSSSCSSSEEMMADIQQANEKGLPEDTIVGSLDVKALYPSLDIDLTARIVAKCYKEHAYEVINVDHNELGLYLAINLTIEELNTKGLTPFCHTRKHKRGRKPVITGCATNNDADKRYAPWNPPQSIPNDKEAKTMLAEALNIGIKFTMENHIYCFNDNIKKQAEGGPIGLELTGEVALVFMTWWDKQFKAKLRENDLLVYAYKRYVDDINIIMKGEKAPGPSHSDKHTLEMVKNIGNSITNCIQLELDCPSNHDDKKLPILDMKVWPEQRKRKYELQNEYTVTIKHTVILHEFYQKDIASKTVTHANSAMSHADVRSILTQDTLRVLLRCSPLLPWDQVLPHVNQMMMRMQFSGHKEQFRKEIVLSAMKAYDTIRDKDKKGTQPMYRPKNWNYKEREIEKRNKRNNWFKKKGDDTVIFLPATPGSILKKQYDQVIKNSDFKIKVVEKAGKNLKSRLQKSHPFQKKPCSKVDQCVMCTRDKGSNCRTNNVTYEFKCTICDDVYIGETARNLFTRGREHMMDYDKKKDNSVLYRHALTKHSESETRPLFKARVTGSYNSALTRQLSEANQIELAGAKAINTKTEWRHSQIARSQIVIS